MFGVLLPGWNSYFPFPLTCIVLVRLELHGRLREPWLELRQQQAAQLWGLTHHLHLEVRPPVLEKWNNEARFCVVKITDAP